MAIRRIAVLSGTGPHGCGLAKHFARAGLSVVIGSRDAGRADAAAASVRTAVAASDVRGAENRAAAAGADTVVLAVAAAGLAPLLAAVGDVLAGKLVIDVVVPLVVADGLARHVPPPGAASAGEAIGRALRASRVVAAFQTVPAVLLNRVDTPLDGDVLVCGDDPSARAQVAELAERIPRLRGVDAGAMANARYVEGITALLVNLNLRHHAHTSITVLGLDGPGRREGSP